MSPFEILGVSHDADEQTIKRAYARKVREHPPESDPAGFQRIAEAFEALKDAEQRARIADAVERPELGRLRAQYAAAREAQDNARAAEVLDEAIARFPDDRDAREAKARFLAEIGRTADAIVAVEDVCSRFPTEVEPLLLKAEIYASTYEYPKAHEAIARARTLAPQDRRPLIVTARIASQMEKPLEAAAALEQALELRDTRFVSDGLLMARRIELHTDAEMLDSARAQVAALVARAQTPEEKQETAGLLTSLAGYLLLGGMAQRGDMARLLFDEARRLDPVRHRFQIGDKHHAQIDRLNGDAQKHVDEIRSKRPQHVVPLSQSGGVFAGVFALVSLISFLIVGIAFLTPGPLGALHGFLAMVSIVSLGGFFLLRRKPSFDFAELRPFHLLKVTGDEVTVIPLMRIANIRPSSARVIAVVLDGGDSVVFESDLDLMPFMGAVVRQLQRLSSLASSDLLETELEADPLRWDAA